MATKPRKKAVSKAEPALETVNTSMLIPYKNNAKIHSTKQVNKIAQSIEEFGFNAPILIDENNIIIAGHGRFEAAKVLNLATVPCRRLTHLSENQKKAYILADNKLGELGTFDATILQAEIDSIGRELGGSAGFDTNELDKLLEGAELELEIHSEPEYMKQDDTNAAADRIFNHVKQLHQASPHIFENGLVILSPRGKQMLSFCRCRFTGVYD